jgi:hypothetical protein
MVLVVAQSPMLAADLQPKTVAAFDRYVKATEARMRPELASSTAFLAVDALPAARRASVAATLRQGGLFIDQLTTREGSQSIDVPDGLIHHWVGLVFVPGASLDQAVTLLQDYDRHADVYRPAVARSRLIARNGDDFRLFLRFSMMKGITVVLNSEHEAHFVRAGRDRAYSRIYSTRIAEVADADTPREREEPVGRDGGYLWRLNSYWRFLERDGGTYVQCESISLTRGVPFGFGWLVGPFVTSIPKESLAFTLETTRATLARVTPR